jgi:hypothetical protein
VETEVETLQPLCGTGGHKREFRIRPSRPLQREGHESTTSLANYVQFPGVEHWPHGRVNQTTRVARAKRVPKDSVTYMEEERHQLPTVPEPEDFVREVVHRLQAVETQLQLK